MRSTKEVIALTFAYYHPGQVLDPTVLDMYAQDLSDIPPDRVIGAYQQYRRDPSNSRFPLPAKIRELVNPQDYISAEDQAAEVAGRICGAVSKFGWNNGRDAEAYIGPVGWGVVRSQGGWFTICDGLGKSINPSTFQAQVRKQLEVNFKYGPDSVDKSIKALPDRKDNGLVQIGEAIKNILPERQGDPEGAA